MKKMISNCKICNKEFNKNNSSITCSKECSYKNKLESTKNAEKIKANELGISRHILRKYGWRFLKDNPIALELAQLEKLMIGKNMPDEIKMIRKKSCKTRRECYYEKYVYKVKICEICNTEYNPVGTSKTCSKECSKKLKSKNKKEYYLKLKNKK